ncbi:hypothetical protein [Maridesulfovibrio ferrireducens]|uniref:hypothetical protein n=1 Tax=Maridesulfovibrio ferrireducens TaxID=246191 RepID=UPI001A225365|nr:hypothetical protein [Maridesulfovibrio ferrireducens]MBI9112225.1 hypothetical protein [Maridesulfovibrio ferrireducens]
MSDTIFDYANCEHNEGFCDGTDCSVCEHGPNSFKLLPNPPGMACTESLSEAVHEAVKYLESLYKFKGDFQAASHAARLENALVRDGVTAS